MEREIMIGDLVRIAPRNAVTTTHSTRVGLVVGFAGQHESDDSAHQSEVCAKIQWIGGSQTVTGLSMVERVR